MPTKLIATKPLTYATRRLLPGDEFEAQRGHARVLIGIKKARRADEMRADVPPPPPEVVAKVDSLDDLRSEAELAGVEVDRRWGAARLSAEIEKARGGA